MPLFYVHEKCGKSTARFSTIFIKTQIILGVFFVQENHHRDVIYEVSTVEIESLSTISALIK